MFQNMKLKEKLKNIISWAYPSVREVALDICIVNLKTILTLRAGTNKIVKINY